MLDERALLAFFEHLEAICIKSPGRLMKMERVCDVLKYMRFSHEEGEKAREMHMKIEMVASAHWPCGRSRCADRKKETRSHYLLLLLSHKEIKGLEKVILCVKPSIPAHRVESTSNVLPPLATVNASQTISEPSLMPLFAEQMGVR